MIIIVFTILATALAPVYIHSHRILNIWVQLESADPDHG